MRAQLLRDGHWPLRGHRERVDFRVLGPSLAVGTPEDLRGGLKEGA